MEYRNPSLELNLDNEPEIKELLQILKQTYSSTTTRQIKEAEEKLRKFDQIIIQNLSKIFLLFTTNELPLPNKKALAIRVKYIFISLGKEKNLELKQLLSYIELFVNNLIEIKNVGNIPVSIIEQFCQTLKFLINLKFDWKTHLKLLRLLQNSKLNQL